MSNRPFVLIAAAAVAAVLAIAGGAIVVQRAGRRPPIAVHDAPPPLADVPPAPRPSAPAVAVEHVPPDIAPASPETTPSVPIGPAAPRPRAAPPRRIDDRAPDSPVVPLPLARAALDAVGADDEAEAVWLAAINDPAMSAHDRSDLIEDLNENGFADPDDVQPEELPLVLARIDLIERVGPDAMDETNAAAFAEAYKDLVTIAARLMQ